MSDDDKVICCACVHEFRAIPVNVQAEIESMRQRVKELEDSLEAAYAAGVVNGELAALKSSQQAAHEAGQGEPVAWMSPHTRNLIEPHRAYPDWIPLYTAPTMLTEQAPCDIPEG